MTFANIQEPSPSIDLKTKCCRVFHQAKLIRWSREGTCTLHLYLSHVLYMMLVPCTYPQYPAPLSCICTVHLCPVSVPYADIYDLYQQQYYSPSSSLLQSILILPVPRIFSGDGQTSNQFATYPWGLCILTLRCHEIHITQMPLYHPHHHALSQNWMDSIEQSPL